MPIRLRLALVVCVFTTALVAIGGLLFTTNMGHDLRATLERSLERRAGRVDAQLAAKMLPLSSGRQPPSPAPDQSLVQIVDTNDVLRYTTEPAGRHPLLGINGLAAAQRKPVLTERHLSVWRNPRLLLAVSGPRGSGLVVIVGTSLDQVLDSTAHVTQGLFLGGPLVVLLGSIGAWVLAGRALRPVEKLRAEAAAVSAAKNSPRLPVPDTRDELASLAKTLNDLLDRVQRSLADQRHFVAAASHELRTPLAALRAELELAARPGRSEKELVQTVAGSARRVDQLVQLSNRLLLLAEADEGALRTQAEVRVLQPVVADALEAQRAHADQRGVVLVLDADPGVRAAIDEMRFRELLDNLLDNAIRHAPADSFVEVSIRSAEEPDSSELEVRDHGDGFPNDFLPLAFEPFSRPDRSRERDLGGSGLGLAIVQKIVEAHGGVVAAANHPDGGAVVRVTLPGASLRAGTGAPQEIRSAAHRMPAGEHAPRPRRALPPSAPTHPMEA